MVALLITLPLSFAFYLLLASEVGVEQAIAAAVIALVALGWSALLRYRGGERRYAFSRAHLAPWARAIAKLPADTARIGLLTARAAIVGGSPGRAAHPAFRFGVADDPVEAARRATAVIAGSLTPDAVVIDIAPGRSNALCHKLAATPSPRDREWLA